MGDELVEVDFKGAIIEAVTEKGVKIGDNWFPKSHCKAMAHFQKDHCVGLVALPEWIVKQKGLHGVVAEHSKKKLDELVEKITKEETLLKVQHLRVRCPNCKWDIVLEFKTTT